MEDVLLQAKVLLISSLGVIAFLPGPKKDGELRITGPLSNLISYTGILLMLGPWVVIPFLDQARFEGSARTVLIIAGSTLLLLGLGLYAFSLRVLLPAFRDHFSEFTPQTLVISGPYQVVRHPIYLASILIFLGLYWIKGASISILFLPILVLTFHFVIWYEEKRILEPKFGSAFQSYRSQVRSALLGLWGGILFVGVYVLFAAVSLLELLQIADFQVIR